MNKKNKINDNKQQEILYLRRRLLFEEIKFQYIFGFIFCYAIVVSGFYLIILFVWEPAKYNDMFLETSIFIGKIIIVLLVLGAIWDNMIPGSKGHTFHARMKKYDFGTRKT